jgi:hypothetical protein
LNSSSSSSSDRCTPSRITVEELGVGWCISLGGT